MENNLEMKSFIFEAHYRYDIDEKDFWEGSIEATDLESAERKIRKNDRRIFKVIWK